jgi:hypothetical protein
MTQSTRPLFELTLGEVSLRAPETPLYLALAAQVLEVRRQELQEGVSVTFPTPEATIVAAQTPVVVPPESIVTLVATPEVVAPVAQQAPPPPTPVTAAAPAAPMTTPTPPARRARWFHDRFPKITFEDGSTQVIQSLDALKELLKNRGLQPHPRGDASMLLWQVRNRLGLAVEQVNQA